MDRLLLNLTNYRIVNKIQQTKALLGGKQNVANDTGWNPSYDLGHNKIIQKIRGIKELRIFELKTQEENKMIWAIGAIAVGIVTMVSDLLEDEKERKIKDNLVTHIPVTNPHLENFSVPKVKDIASITELEQKKSETERQLEEIQNKIDEHKKWKGKNYGPYLGEMEDLREKLSQQLDSLDERIMDKRRFICRASVRYIVDTDGVVIDTWEYRRLYPEYIETRYYPYSPLSYGYPYRYNLPKEFVKTKAEQKQSHGSKHTKKGTKKSKK